MEKNIQVWSQKTTPILTAVLIYSVAGILATIVISLTSWFGIGRILFYFIGAAHLVGLALFILALGHFSTILEYADSNSIRSVRTGAIVNLAGVAFTLIPFMLWASLILNVIGWILMLIGYMALKNSPTFPAQARKGASHLFLAMIINLIAGLVGLLFGWIPIIRVGGGIIAFMLFVVALILTLAGWISIKNADPNVMQTQNHGEY